MKPVIKQLGDSFLYSCAFEKTYTYEQFVPETVLVFQISGQTEIYHQKGEIILNEGQILLARGNQFAKCIKIPADDKEYRCISVLLSFARLRKFALDNEIICEEKYDGNKNIILESNPLLNGYFLSILPYVDQLKNVSEKLMSIKVNEAIELLLHLHPHLQSLLFNLANPHKQDLETFMLKNFHYNASVEHFARLSGRSLTGFKRDFSSVFKTSPRAWLKNKRLSEAAYLIRQKSRKPQDIYLDLGFENLSHFYTSFKQKYGVTPAQIISKNK
jgi:AraC family transcriptional regulator, exoenzyme S synthesis regulatory protein ExsA